MELEQVAKQLKLLAAKDDLSPMDHQRVRALMKELRKMGMTNAQISELTGERWAETTVKEYTRGVRVVDPQPWQSTAALLGEMLSRGLTTEDVKETIAVRDKLESGGTSLAEITELIGELKGAGIDVRALVELYRKWKASGLTPTDAASALKYKGEIEAAGFGLGSLSDIAQAAKALGSPEEVLKAIEKYRDITELDEELKASQERLAEEESKVKQRMEFGEQQVREIKEREQSAKDRLSQLEEKANAKVELLSKAEELEKLGLDAAKLSDLCTAVTRIGVEHGLGHGEALDKFFDELIEYDAALGFEVEAKKWETIAEAKRLEGDTVKAQLENLEMRYKESKEAVDAMKSLLKRGIKPDDIVAWNSILGSFKGPGEFAKELEEYIGMENLLKAKAEEVQRCELRVAELQSQEEALQKEKAGIEAAIEALRVSGVEQIKAIGEKAVKQIDLALKRAFETGQRLERMRQELQKYERVKDILESHAIASEAAK